MVVKDNELFNELIQKQLKNVPITKKLRYNDLKRWRIAHIKLPTLKTPAGTSLVFTETLYTLPFLQYELDNNPQLVPNPSN